MTQSLLTRPLIFFLATMVLANIARTVFEPFLPLYLQSLGAGVEQVGLFFTISAIAPLFFQIAGGWLSDRIGRLQAIAVGSLAGVASHLIYLIAPTWQWLLAAAMFGALTGSFVRPSFDAFVAEQSTQDTRGRVYGIVHAVFAVVGIVGPPIGGYLAQGLNFKALFLVAAIMYAVAAAGRIAMALNAMRRETRPREKAGLGNLRASFGEIVAFIALSGAITWIFVSDGVLDIGMNFIFQLMPIYMENLHHISPIEIGWLASAMGIATMLVVGGGGWLSDRYGEHVGIALGVSCFALAMVAFVMGGGLIGFGVAFVLFGIGEALDRPAYQSLISKVVPERLRGIAFGVLSTSTGFFSLPSPYLGSLAYLHISPEAPFLITGAALAMLLPIIWLKLRAPKTELEPTP